jgi:hypothetical protein
MRGAAITILGLGMLAGACSATPEAPHGSPVLLEVRWVASGESKLIWSHDADAAVDPRVSPAGAEVDFVFDRRLDGTKIEDIVDGKTVPKPVPPIEVDWPGKNDATAPVMSSPPFSYKVYYNSTAVFGGQTAFAFLRPTVVGFPSSTTVALVMHATEFTSAYGEQMEGPTEFSVELDAMTIVPRTSASDAVQTFGPTFKFPVRFSNRPANIDVLTPFARARAGDVELAVTLTADATEPVVVYVAPAACLGGWPTGSVIDVSFAAGTPDAFGIPSAAALLAGSFQIGGSAESSRDAACD